MNNKLIKKLVFLKDNEVLTDSRIIAKELEREHYNIMKVIKKLIADLKDIDQNRQVKFYGGSYSDTQSQTRPMYLLNEKACELLLMRISGKKALEKQLQFIEAFHFMKEFIKTNLYKTNPDWVESREQGKLIRKELTDIIDDFVGYANHQGSKNANTYFSNITIAINKVLFGINSIKKLKKNLRDYCNPKQLIRLSYLEQVTEKILEKEMINELPYKKIYQIFKTKIEEICEYFDIEKPEYLDNEGYKKLLPKKLKRQLDTIPLIPEKKDIKL